MTESEEDLEKRARWRSELQTLDDEIDEGRTARLLRYHATLPAGAALLDAMNDALGLEKQFKSILESIRYLDWTKQPEAEEVLRSWIDRIAENLAQLPRAARACMQHLSQPYPIQHFKAFRTWAGKRLLDGGLREAWERLDSDGCDDYEHSSLAYYLAGEHRPPDLLLELCLKHGLAVLHEPENPSPLLRILSDDNETALAMLLDIGLDASAQVTVNDTAKDIELFDATVYLCSAKCATLLLDRGLEISERQLLKVLDEGWLPIAARLPVNRIAAHVNSITRLLSAPMFGTEADGKLAQLTRNLIAAGYQPTDGDFWSLSGIDPSRLEKTGETFSKSCAVLLEAGCAPPADLIENLVRGHLDVEDGFAGLIRAWRAKTRARELARTATAKAMPQRGNFGP
jgi:hypothetical protein